MGKPKKIELLEARARWDKLLKEFYALRKKDSSMSQNKFAVMKKLSRARIGQIFKRATEK